MRVKQENRELTLSELILLRNYYREKLDNILKVGFDENNNNHKICEERFTILDYSVLNKANQLEW